MTFIHRNDVQNLIPSVTLSLSKSSIHSCYCHHYHLLVAGFFFLFFSFVMLLSLLLRLLMRYHFFFHFHFFSHVCFSSFFPFSFHFSFKYILNLTNKLNENFITVKMWKSVSNWAMKDVVRVWEYIYKVMLINIKYILWIY